MVSPGSLGHPIKLEPGRAGWRMGHEEGIWPGSEEEGLHPESRGASWGVLRHQICILEGSLRLTVGKQMEVERWKSKTGRDDTGPS